MSSPIPRDRDYMWAIPAPIPRWTWWRESAGSRDTCLLYTSRCVEETGAKRTAEKRTSLEQEAGELRVRERETGARRENVGHELARLQERSENLQREYDTIISRLWEEYELTRREAEEIGKKIEDLPAAQKRLNELKNRIKALGAVNVGAVVELSLIHI